MSGLPNLIPQQSVPFGHVAQDGNLYVDINWYLVLYNLWKEVLGSGGSGTAPISPFDLLDAVDLLAATSEIPQAFRQIANLKAIIGSGQLPAPVPLAQPAQTITVGATPFTWTAPFDGTLSVSSATSGGSFTDEKGGGGTPGFAAGVDYVAGTTTSLTLSQSYGSAADLWVAFDGDDQGADTYTLSGKTLTFNAAIPVGPSKVFVKGYLPSSPNVSAISIIRQGVSVPTSMNSGLIPVSRSDQVQITYSSAPTVVFLPR